MPTRYMTLDEAAALLGIGKDRLVRLREQGEIRGFADRGTWKFRPEDVEKLREKLAASPELGQESDFEKTVIESAEPRAGVDRPDSDPEVRLAVDSDSDVALVGKDEVSESDSDVKMIEEPADEDSDSDVKLVSEETPEAAEREETVAEVEAASDSDVRLVDSDSDVRLVEETAALVDKGESNQASVVESDSDVRVEEHDSDSDVRLTEESSPLVDAESDSDVRLAGLDSDSDVRLASDAEVSAPKGPPAEQEEEQAESDSDVALLEEDEGETIPIKMDEPAQVSAEEQSAEKTGEESEEESGISLATESGISLDQPVDSGISLEEDSGITLELTDESGIALEEADESGIALEEESTSDETTDAIPGISAEDEQETTADTVFEVPSLEEDVDFDLKEPADTEAETNVLLFDEEDLQTQPAGKAKEDATAAEEETFDFDWEGEESAEAATAMAEEAEADIFGAEEVEFEESFETGESQPEFVAPAVGLGRAAPAIEPEWGLSVFVPLALGSVLLCVCGMVMYDLIRSIWGWHAVSAFNSPLLEFLAGLLK